MLTFWLLQHRTHSEHASTVSPSSAILQSIFLTSHTVLASMQRWCLPEGAFSTLDGAVASIEWVWYNQEDSERHKKQLHRAAKTVSCTGHAV